MLRKSILKSVPLTFGLMFLGACATTENTTAPAKTAEVTEKMTDAKVAKEVSDKLSSTKTTAKSVDGKMICKRTSVVGSNFKRKVCATAEEWDARSAADRKTTATIQRSAGPGVSN